MPMGKINRSQRQLMIEFLHNNPKLLSGKFSSTFTFKDAEQKWRELSVKLNSIPGGATKDWRSWRKTLQDIRSRTKGKIVTNKTNLNKTGHGPYQQDDISVEDQQVLDLINPVTITGHQEMTESVVSIVLDGENEIPQELGNLEAETFGEEVPSCSYSTPRKQEQVNSISREFSRTIQNRGGIKLKKTDRAVQAHEQYLGKKLNIKEKYYEAKLQLKREKNEIAKQNSESLRKIEDSIKLFVEKM